MLDQLDQSPINDMPEQQVDGAGNVPPPTEDPVAEKSRKLLEATSFFNNKLQTSSAVQNENLFKQYRSVPGKNTEKYLDADQGFSPLIDNEDYYAQTQSGMEKIGKGLLKLPLYTVTKLGSGIGFVTGLINPANWFAEEGYISAVADNGISNFFNSWEDDIKNQWLPTFQEAEDRDKGFFARAATDVDFWTEDFVDGLAFMASAWVPGMALSKAGLGLKAINGLSKLGTVGLESAGASVEAIGATTKYFKNAATYAKGLDKFNSWAIATSSEAMFEAKGVRDSIMESLEGSSFTEAQKKQIAGDNAQNAFLMNAALLGVTNVFELPLVTKMLNKTQGVARGLRGGATLGEDIAVKEATTRAGKFLESGYGRFAKDVTKGVFREGYIEENGQLAIQRFNEQYGAAGKVADMLDSDTYEQLGSQYLSQTKGSFSGEDKEASTSIGLGGILGGGMTAIGNSRQAKKDKITTQQAVDYYNQTQANWLKFGNIYETEKISTADANGNAVVTEKIKLDQNNQPIIDKQKLAGVTSSVRANAALVDQTEDDTNMSRRNLARDNAFAEFTLAHINAGMEDGLMEKLDAVAKSSPEDLAKLGFMPDESTPAQINRYKTLAATIIRQNKIINSDIIFDGSKEDEARKYRLSELAAKQAVYKGLAADEQNRYNEVRNELVNDQNTSLTDGLVDQLNNLLLRIKSQEQYVKELKGEKGLSKSQVKVAEEMLSELNDRLAKLKTDNETSIQGLKTFNNGLYEYEKEGRNDPAFLNPLIRRQKYLGELQNHIQLLGREWGMYADFNDGKKNFLDMFIDEQIVQPVNQVIDEKNNQVPPPAEVPPVVTTVSKDEVDQQSSYSYEGKVYNITVIDDMVSMMSTDSADENSNIMLSMEEFKKALADNKITAVAPPVNATLSNETRKEDIPDDLEEYLKQEYERVKTASLASGAKLLPYEDWKRTAGVIVAKRWMQKKGQQETPATETTEQPPVSTDAKATVKGALVAQGTSIELEIVGDTGKQFLLTVDRKGNINLFSEKQSDGSYKSGEPAPKEAVDKLYNKYVPEKTRTAITNWLNALTGSWAAPETEDGKNYDKAEKALNAELAALEGAESTEEAEEQPEVPTSTLEKELEDLGNQLRKDLGSTTELRFMKVGTIGYDKDGNKYQVVSKKDKYGRSLEYRKNDGPEQSFNPKTASKEYNSLGYYPEAFVELYSKNPKNILDKYNSDKAAIEEKYKQLQQEQQSQTGPTQDELEDGDTSSDINDFVQDLGKNRKVSIDNNNLANAEYQEGLRQVAPHNSLANATDIAKFVRIDANQVRQERDGVNPNYVFDVATATFMPGHAVTFKVMSSGLPVTNRLTGTTYQPGEIFGEDGKVKAEAFDVAPIGVFAVINGQEVQIGSIHEPDWIEYKIGSKFVNIAIPEDQADQAYPDVVKAEVLKNRELRQQILENYNKNPTFVMKGVVEQKSLGVLRTTETTAPISQRVNPRIAEGGTDNRHGMFAIVRDGFIQSDRNLEVDKIEQTESFSPENVANYQGIAVLLLPTPKGTYFPTFIQPPNVSTEQAEFVIEAWKAFTGQTSNPELVKAVYDAMGLVQSSGDFSIGVLRDYINHYITLLSNEQSKKPSRLGNGNDAPMGAARLNITNKGGLELEVMDARTKTWFATEEPIMKAEQLPVDYLSKMTNLRTTIRFASVKNDNLKGINSTEKATILSIQNGKLVKEQMTYNQYIMNRATTFVDKGVQSKNAFKDWVYFANPVVKMKVTQSTDPAPDPEVKTEQTPAPTVEQVNTERPDKGAALLAALRAKNLQEKQVEEQKENCTSLRSKLNNIM